MVVAGAIFSCGADRDPVWRKSDEVGGTGEHARPVASTPVGQVEVDDLPTLRRDRHVDSARLKQLPRPGAAGDQHHVGSEPLIADRDTNDPVPVYVDAGVTVVDLSAVMLCCAQERIPQPSPVDTRHPTDMDGSADIAERGKVSPGLVAIEQGNLADMAEAGLAPPHELPDKPLQLGRPSFVQCDLERSGYRIGRGLPGILEFLDELPVAATCRPNQRQHRIAVLKAVSGGENPCACCTRLSRFAAVHDGDLRSGRCKPVCCCRADNTTTNNDYLPHIHSSVTEPGHRRSQGTRRPIGSRLRLLREAREGWDCDRSDADGFL